MAPCYLAAEFPPAGRVAYAPEVPRAAPLAALALALALAPLLGRAADEAPAEVAQLGGRCTRALVRGDDWTAQCAPMALRATFGDGHETLHFFIQGATELSFRVFRQYRKEPGLHVLLVDQLRLKKTEHPVPGFCTVTGAFTDPARLAFDRPVTMRCRAGVKGEVDLADVTFAADPPRPAKGR